MFEIFRFIHLFYIVLQLKLKHFEKFKDTTEVSATTTAAVERKLTKSLKKVCLSQCVSLYAVILGKFFVVKNDWNFSYIPGFLFYMKGKNLGYFNIIPFFYFKQESISLFIYIQETM